MTEPPSPDSSPDPPLAYAFDWRPDEHARVIRRIVRERYDRRLFRWLRGGIYVLLLFAAVVAWAAWTGGDTSGASRLAVLIVLVGALLVSFPWLVGLLRAWRTGREDPNVTHPLRLTLGEGGVRIGGHTADTTLRWDGLQKVREDDEFFLFYYSKWTAYYLPKRVVGGEIEALRSTIREALPEDVPFLKD